ncbi:probable pectate lyase P59 [Sesamum indicum]|uniref:Pectate lyase n=1 Tax=Sesamum indicum TaxID=4182 RepID=A0A6I9TQI6_SESIN|nr:probable pectate lyase P59 [Sesamum indicum]
MEGTKLNWLLISFLAFASILPLLRADIAEYDEVWRRRAAEAYNRTVQAYHPDPLKVVMHFNKHVNKHVEESGGLDDVMMLNTTRRHLGKAYKGPCKVTNPIDACWRCNPKWHLNRFRLADCGMGFGSKATGGKGGRIYMVTDKSDDDVLNPKPGTLRHAVIQEEPLWITFRRNMVIKLKQELMVTSDKTIDGRGAIVQIAYGAGITIQFVKNVIIHNLKIHHIVEKDGGLIRDSASHTGLRTQSDGDGISIFGSQDIWIDHVSMTRCADGLIDIIQGSTGITISNSHFTDHDHAMLFGGNDKYPGDEKMQITVAFNHFGKRMVQRMPRCRYGFFHVVNNDYTHWKMYAIGGSSHPTIISQGNRYIADHPYAKQVTKRECPESEWKHWTWVTDGDLFLRGAYFIPSGDQDWPSKHPEKSDNIKPASAKLVSQMTKFAGRLGCKLKYAC